MVSDKMCAVKRLLDDSDGDLETCIWLVKCHKTRTGLKTQVPPGRYLADVLRGDCLRCLFIWLAVKFGIWLQAPWDSLIISAFIR